MIECSNERRKEYKRKKTDINPNEGPEHVPEQIQTEDYQPESPCTISSHKHKQRGNDEKNEDRVGVYNMVRSLRDVRKHLNNDIKGGDAEKINILAERLPDIVHSLNE